MVCPKCMAEVQEDGIFCSVCGARVDGKKTCPKCKKLIDENSIFCTYCGERVDGKKVCSKCGTVFDGEFCSNCGENSIKTEKPNTINEGGVIALKERYNAVERILSPSLLLLSILLMFIGGFLIQVEFSISTAVVGLKTTDNCTVFSFFGDFFEEVNGYIASCKENWDCMEFGLKVPIIITLIVIIANFIVSAICFVFALVKYIKGVVNKEKVDLVKPFTYVLLTFLVTALLVFGYYSFSYDFSYLDDVAVNYIDGTTIKQMQNALTFNGGASLNSSTAVFLIITAVFGVGVYVLDAFRKGKEFKTKENITKCVFLFAMLALLVVSMFIICTSGETLSQGEGKKLKVSAGYIMREYWTQINEFKDWASFETQCDMVLISSMACYIINVAMIIVGGFMVLQFIRKLFNNKERNRSIIVLAVIETLLSVLYLASSILLKNNINESLNIEGTANISVLSTIVVLVLSAVLLGSVIAYSIVRKYQQKEMVE